jgi:hypothetical protein
MSELLTDNFERRIADLEKRLARLESMERRAPMTFGPAPKHESQWCDCGRDGCRWPYCKTRENNCGNDPLGR